MSIKHIVVYDTTTGAIKNRMSIPEGDIPFNVPTGAAYIETEELHEEPGFHIDLQTGQLALKPVPLEELKERKWEEMKRHRSAEEFGEFTWNGLVFDADKVSQARIQGSVQLASLIPGFEVTWTLKDNSTVDLTALDLEEVGIALGMSTMTAHAKGKSVRAMIMAATTAAEVELVEWPE
ncbi:DUF4376 domain-containing protein [Kineobactrum salinum]|uniref:DUF4376 domain-containing protein n=1 Tax=Kineobactrum salinum TaxID=2708301 RepID=A0A6C0U4U6_9GAMM|nr:DUF4376 domain-containing protein [Kineobactrum salinum]QIB67180.1 DUF4376 domain-containing protein [Kineobactrum salinum]